MFIELIDIALSDLKASRILYEQQQYRNSYYLFQQASEKASKAFGLDANIVSTEELKKRIGHQQLKIHQKAFKDRRDEIEATRHKADARLMTLVSKMADIDGVSNSLALMSEYLEDMSSKDVTELSIIYLGELLDILKSLKGVKISSLRGSNELLRNKLFEIMEWIKDFSDCEIELELQEVIRVLEDDNLIEKIKVCIKPILEFVLDFVFVMMTLLFCGLVTSKQNERTRYPTGNRQLKRIYNKRLPIIKMQPEFIAMLGLAIRKMKKLRGFNAEVLVTAFGVT